jgi:hypothetical protein
MYFFTVASETWPTALPLSPEGDSPTAVIMDQTKVQRDLASVSAEIARLEGERMTAEHRVSFAQVLFSLREEVPAPAGFSDALCSLSAIVIFAVGRGPVILLWVLLIYFPARWAWRKWRPALQTGEVMAHG